MMTAASPTSVVISAGPAVAVTPAAAAPPAISGFTTIMGVTINPMVMVLAAILLAVAVLLYWGQRENGENTFDLWDLLMDTLDEGKRRASGIKCTYLAAFLISSWVVIDQEIKGTLSELIFGAYLSVWCLSLIAKVVFDKKDLPDIRLGKRDG